MRWGRTLNQILNQNMSENDNLTGQERHFTLGECRMSGDTSHFGFFSTALASWRMKGVWDCEVLREGLIRWCPFLIGTAGICSRGDYFGRANGSWRSWGANCPLSPYTSTHTPPLHTPPPPHTHTHVSAIGTLWFDKTEANITQDNLNGNTDWHLYASDDNKNVDSRNTKTSWILLCKPFYPAY
jgi:hypothetical protein